MERELIERLRNPNYAGPMQHLRSWSEIDQICNSAADLIESLRAQLDEARRKTIEEAAQIAVDHADGSTRLSRLADMDGDKESSRIHINDAFAFRSLAAAIRNMGGEG